MPHTRKEILAIGKEIANKIFHKKKVEEVTIKGWIARNTDNVLAFYTRKPIKNFDYWAMLYPTTCYLLGIRNDFPSVQWSDPEPTPATITIKIEK